MNQERWKKNAAKEAAKLVEDDMIVGIGSGSTLAEVVRILGEKGSKADFVCGSIATQKLAERLGLNVVSLEKNSQVDITIDGADEVDPKLSMIKGGGGAHTREKIVASAAREVAIVVDKTKLVDNLGEKNPVPVEIIPFAGEYIAGLLENLGSETKLRISGSGELFVTDNGNYIIDADFGILENPSELETALNEVPGVIENGIFVDMADEIFVGYENGCEIVENEQEFMELTKEIK